ncbi:thiol:disulfide interchange protein DsbE, partial [Salmonella enterica subsp. enterica serovar Heidelberg str. RI-11-014319]
NLESALTGKPVPAFRLESLETPGQYYQAEVLTQGKPVLLNVWATWCPTCRAEHQYLNQLSAQGIRGVGLNYKDDRAKAVAWLKELGNPYALSLSDSDGMLGLDLGVYPRRHPNRIPASPARASPALPPQSLLAPAMRGQDWCATPSPSG